MDSVGLVLAALAAGLVLSGIRVANQYELKLQLAELARWLLLDPAERARLQAEAVRGQALLLQATLAEDFGLHDQRQQWK